MDKIIWGDPILKFKDYKVAVTHQNRFNIAPGKKWDQKDRSNGFEEQYFLKQNEKKAQQEDAYKWRSKDM